MQSSSFFYMGSFVQIFFPQLSGDYTFYFYPWCGYQKLFFFLNMHILFIKFKFNQQLYCPPKFQYISRLITVLFSLPPSLPVMYHCLTPQFHLIFMLSKLIIIFVVILYCHFFCFCLFQIYSHVYLLLWVSLIAQLVKNLPAVQETWVQSLGWEDPREKEKATNSSTGRKEPDVTE